MEAETKYPVCPDRNVAAAFQCFIGPDACGLERFFEDQRRHWGEDALYIVRRRGRWALASLVRELQESAQAFSEGLAVFNPAMASCWTSVVFVWAAMLHGLLTGSGACLRYLAYHAVEAMHAALPRAAAVTRWAVNYRLPLPRTSRFRGLPV